ncbi:histone-lysine N-methyltransferase family member SUVH2-like isoform X1 [Phalaenopsis equestris]|uniref:histone-lysine N-methyltransferase family member SUVH2-like isoform X1 n=1 Tax=Phalaenopsis equestris TaxID=78828 RepID=UPI0009E5709B|nr:histone-lysine N-methyltransferase family member SUVH2-like isoform X1 [Phalaenopsis equestris]XP_020575299.1 histone-lysine N-methyltransferase family member SUVH2-like isoform X2 [Phalaenopsis equestris]XP_020575301.1 histone-lysine N-methyltransferase family member SUVH2-like isoform X1 [Phalaenopsis equestris]
MASSSCLDLSLVLVPKIEPKEEPIETDLLISPIRRKLDSCTAFCSRIDSSVTNKDALFSEYHLLDRHFQTAEKLPGSIFTDLPYPQFTTASSTMVVRKKRKARSSEMVRISFLSDQDHICFRHLVRRARITFESLRVCLIRDDERGENLEVLRRRNRTDIKAAVFMADRGLWLNRDKRIIGSIPGIFVGDVFFFRMELYIIGLHGQVQAGIDYVPARRSSCGEPIATSIIVSGGYEDDEDNGDVLIYTGHGGRHKNLHKMCDQQKLEGGNLALERSMKYGIEIRVIRRAKIDHSPTGRVYVYDGLYKIVDCWLDVGKSGYGVYKYKLLRIEGQEEMGSATLKLAESLKSNSTEVRKTGFFCNDFSEGRESFPVSFFNDLDDNRDPLHFDYLARPIYPPAFQEKFHGECRGGCQCGTNCSSYCICATLNGGEFAYDSSGILLRGKPMIYECGIACRCPLSCPNRVSQKGIQHRLEVFRSNETGWGVRSWDLIRAGTFICEFSGIVLTKQQTELLSMAGESLVYPNRFPERWVEWGDISDVFPDFIPPKYPCLSELSFSLDVSRARNVASYFCHSCCPNAFVQFVLYDHYNLLYPHLMIFAMENIPPLRELSIDYGELDEWLGKMIA